MTKEGALKNAQVSAAQTGMPYAIVQAKNGQWMVERQAFLDSDPRGRMIYAGRPRINVETRPRNRVPKVSFQGNEYIIINNALTTTEDYRLGRVPFARIMKDGFIWRFRKKIGVKGDLVHLGEVELPEPTDVAKRTIAMGMFTNFDPLTGLNPGLDQDHD